MRSLLLVVLFLLLTPAIDASASETLALPRPLVNAGVASDGHNVYAFGGFLRGEHGREASADIVRIDPGSARIERVAELPSPRMGATAVWTGREFLVVGGLDARGPLDQIVAYEPKGHLVRVVAARLPEPISNAAAVWNGTHLLVLGGIKECRNACPSLSTAVLAYDPSLDSLQPLSARLPHGTSSSAVFDGEHAYLLGGISEATGGGASDLILRYRPGDDRVDILPQKLPRPLMGAGLAWDGARAFLLGGEQELQRPTREVFAFTPLDGEVRLVDVPLPEARSALGAAMVDGRAYAVGGLGCGGRYCATVLGLDLRAAALLPIPADILDRQSIREARPIPAATAAVALVGAACATRLRRAALAQLTLSRPECVQYYMLPDGFGSMPDGDPPCAASCASSRSKRASAPSIGGVRS